MGASGGQEETSGETSVLDPKAVALAVEIQGGTKSLLPASVPVVLLSTSVRVTTAPIRSHIVVMKTMMARVRRRKRPRRRKRAMMAAGEAREAAVEAAAEVERERRS